MYLSQSHLVCFSFKLPLGSGILYYSAKVTSQFIFYISIHFLKNCFPRTMVNLYEDPEWSSKDLEGYINEIRKHVVKNKLCCFSVENLKYYEKEMCRREKEGHNITFSDLWGLLVEAMLRDKVL